MNQGAWSYVKPRIDALLNYAGMSDRAKTSYVGRPPSSASATGLYKVHEKELEEFLTLAFQ
jgi:2-oxoglutarate dehydrogenase complex dehydrogenase (E1) component-like enzyme